QVVSLLLGSLWLRSGDPMTKETQTRLVTWRLKVLRHASDVTHNVARTCRHFGITRQTFYKWKRRHDAHGDAGLCDRPKRPRRSPKETRPVVVSKILYLRQNYHFGPGTISGYLRRFHEVSVAKSTVRRILVKHGMRRLPENEKYRRHSKRWIRYEKPKP